MDQHGALFFHSGSGESTAAAAKFITTSWAGLGIMSGPQSDLRTGLAWQTVMNGSGPYHEPMRLLTLIEAPQGKNR